MEAMRTLSGCLAEQSASSSSQASNGLSEMSSMFSKPMTELSVRLFRRAYLGTVLLTFELSRLMVLQTIPPQPSEKERLITFPFVPGGPLRQMDWGIHPIHCNADICHVLSSSDIVFPSLVLSLILKSGSTKLI